MIASVLAELPRAQRYLVPLREQIARSRGEALPPVEFAVDAFATGLLPMQDAMALLDELRGAPLLDGVTVVAVTPEADELADFVWERICARAQSLLPTLASRATRPLMRPSSIATAEWWVSASFYGTPDQRALYVIDVAPWAAPLALQWMKTPESWRTISPMLRRWHELHGFYVVGLGRDWLEAWVDNPPVANPDVDARCAESMTFCSGYVEDQEERREMVRGHTWRFRFDI